MGGRGCWPHGPCGALPLTSARLGSELAFIQVSGFTTYLPPSQGWKPGLRFCSRQTLSKYLVSVREVGAL